MVFEPNGIIVPIVTPFDANDDINEAVYKRLIDFVIDSGVHGIFTCGSQGEFWALSKDEKKRLFQTTVEHVNGRVPVYAGTGAESTKEVIELTRMAKDVGVDAVSIITPYFVKPDDKGLVDHYTMIAERVDIPMLLYGNPGRTGGVVISPDSLSELADECANIVGIKDSGGDLSLTLEYIKKSGNKISVLAGRDSIIFQTLISGGRGAISASANVIPKLIISVYDCVRRRDYENANDFQKKISDLRSAFELGVFPSVIKESVSAMGFDVGPCRMPVTPLKAKDRESLVGILKSLGVNTRSTKS